MNPIEAAESALIGTLLRHPEQVQQLSWLHPADFSEGGRAEIFANIRSTVDAGVPVDPVRISSEVRAAYRDSREHRGGMVTGPLRDQPTHPSLVTPARLHSMLALAGDLGEADAAVYGRMVLEASLRRELRGLGVEVSAAALGEPATAPGRVMAAAENLLGQVEQLRGRWHAATDLPRPDTTDARRQLARWAIERELTHHMLRTPAAAGLSTQERALLADLADTARTGDDQELTRKASDVAATLQASPDRGVRALGREAARCADALRGDRAALEWAVSPSGTLASAYETLHARELGHDVALADLDSSDVRVQAIPDTTSGEPHAYWVTVAHLPNSRLAAAADDGLAAPKLTAQDAAALRAHHHGDQHIAGLAVIDRVLAESAVAAAADAVTGPGGRVHNELLYGGTHPGAHTVDAVAATLHDTTRLLARVRAPEPPAAPPDSDRALSHQQREAAAQQLAEADRPTPAKIRAAEQRLIAAALTTDPSTLTARLEPGDFTNRDTAAAWTAISTLHDSHQPVNLVTVAWEQQRGARQHGPGLPVDELRTLAEVAPIGIDDDADLIAAHRLYQVAETVRTNFDTTAQHPGVTVDGLLETGQLSAQAIYTVAHRIRPAYGDIDHATHLAAAAKALPSTATGAGSGAEPHPRAHRITDTITRPASTPAR